MVQDPFDRWSLLDFQRLRQLPPPVRLSHSLHHRSQRPLSRSLRMDQLRLCQDRCTSRLKRLCSTPTSRLPRNRVSQLQRWLLAQSLCRSRGQCDQLELLALPAPGSHQSDRTLPDRLPKLRPKSKVRLLAVAAQWLLLALAHLTRRHLHEP